MNHDNNMLLFWLQLLNMHTTFKKKNNKIILRYVVYE